MIATTYLPYVRVYISSKMAEEAEYTTSMIVLVLVKRINRWLKWIGRLLLNLLLDSVSLYYSTIPITSSKKKGEKRSDKLEANVILQRNAWMKERSPSPSYPLPSPLYRRLEFRILSGGGSFSLLYVRRPTATAPNQGSDGGCRHKKRKNRTTLCSWDHPRCLGDCIIER